jgi:phosphopantothenoylcysteine decarboxylase/phosphopantothenate--cysteine ligase
MGYALANAAAQQGAEVTLISGPTTGNTTHPNVSIVAVNTASEMLDACLEVYDNSDALIMAAAVADFQPMQQVKQKIKKQAGLASLSLAPTPDILSKLGAQKKDQLLIGFALETQDAIANAQKKLIAKNLDAIVVNSLADEGAGFGHDTNKISFLQANKEAVLYELKSKQEVALDVMDQLKSMFDES